MPVYHLLLLTGKENLEKTLRTHRLNIFGSWKKGSYCRCIVVHKGPVLGHVWANLSLKIHTPIAGPLWHIKVQYLAMYEANLTLKMGTILIFFILVSYSYAKI